MWEKNLKENGVCICITNSLCCTAEIIVSQLYFNKFLKKEKSKPFSVNSKNL